MYNRPAHMVPLFPGESKILAELAMKVHADAAELGGRVRICNFVY